MQRPGELRTVGQQLQQPRGLVLERGGHGAGEPLGEGTPLEHVRKLRDGGVAPADAQHYVTVWRTARMPTGRRTRAAKYPNSARSMNAGPLRSSKRNMSSADSQAQMSWELNSITSASPAAFPVMLHVGTCSRPSTR